MDTIKDDLTKEILAIREKIEAGLSLNEEDFKIILLNNLHEENLHEVK